MRWLIYYLIFYGVASAADPKWIWWEASKKNQTVYFRREFKLPKVPKAATFRGGGTADMIIFINGNRLGEAKHAKPMTVLPATHLRKGLNVITLQCKSINHPAGIALGLEMVMSNGDALSVSSGSSFMCRDTKPSTPWRTLTYKSKNWKAATVRPANKFQADPLKLYQVRGRLHAIDLGVQLDEQFHLTLLGAGRGILGPFTMVEGLILRLYGTAYTIDEVDTVKGQRIFWLKSKRTGRRYGAFRYENGSQINAGGLRLVIQP